jgi:hypothetical protein
MIAVDCGPPPPLPHATPRTYSLTYENATVTYTCEAGYVAGDFAGDVGMTDTVTCGSDGAWTECNLTCVGKERPRHMCFIDRLDDRNFKPRVCTDKA